MFLSQWMLKHSVLVRVSMLIGAGLLLAITLIGTLELKQNSDPSVWIDPDTQAYAEYTEIRRLFADESTVSIFMRSADVLSSENLTWIAEVQEEVEKIPYIEKTLSVLNAQDLMWDELGPSPVDLVRDDSAEVPLDESEIAYTTQHPLYADRLLGSEANWTMVVVYFKEDSGWQNIVESGVAIQGVLDLHQPPVGDCVLAGISIQQDSMNHAIVADQKRIFLWSAGAMILITCAVFGSPLLCIIPCLSMVSACAATATVLVLCDQKLDAVLGLLPPLIAAITVASSLHLIYAAYLCRDDTAPLRMGLIQSARGIIGSSLTTIFGFGGLMLSSLPAVQTFGVYAVVGVVCAVLSSYLWAIVLLPWKTHSIFSLPSYAGVRLMVPAMRAIGRWSTSVRYVVIVSWTVIAIAAIVALMGVRTDNDLLSALPQDMPIVEAQHRIDETVGGSTALELLIQLDHLVGADDIQALDTMAVHKGETQNIHLLWSINDIIRFGQKAAGQADDPQRAVDVLHDVRDYLPQIYNRFVVRTESGKSNAIRVLGLCPDIELNMIVTDIKILRKIALNAFPDATIYITTPHQLLKESADAFLPAVLSSLYFIIPSIGIIAFALFRTVSALVVALVSILIPTTVGLACLPVFSWPMDLPQTMIACLVIGIVIDDVVHWLVCRQHSVDSMSCNAEIGPILAASSLILIAASACYVAGDFAHSQRFGVVMSATFTCAIIMTLTLLPAIFVHSKPKVSDKDAHIKP